uniref:Ribosomal protein S7 n=1 Tax=Olisthodiscus luteus TaxID=83000 RepID=A0A7U0KRX7_OLILU|nr:ribosomal protein S7 [Olisthodiscus luteus]QQW50570.1 ribosomal protein S7 [Olisthodiscus luteus]
MGRKNSKKKSFPGKDPNYNSYLVSLLTNRIMKDGKKSLAEEIIRKCFTIIEKKTNADPLITLERAIKNVMPRVEVKGVRVGGSTYQVPIEINRFRGTNLALRWIITFSRKRAGRSIALNLANELLEAANKTGNSIKRREETHRMAEANKAYAHYRY